MNEFSFVFLFFLSSSLVLKFWLNHRQIAHVTKHRDSVPEAFSRQIDLPAHQKAADYTVSNTRFANINIVFEACVLLLFTLGGGIDWLAGLSDQMISDNLLAGTSLILTVFILSHLIGLPLDCYHTFVLEERFGFNRSTVSQYIKDQLLQTGLMLALGVPLIYGLLWVMGAMGVYWWVYAWALVLGFSFFMTWLFPTVIAPLFNKFTLLDKPELKERIQQLLERCGFNSDGIYVMDGSRRSGHGNAYFTGIGDKKRIVFYDTLVDSLSPDEIEAVLAHELGHFKCKHIRKQMISSAILTFAGFTILGWISQQAWFFSGLSVSQMNNASALLLFLLVSPVFTLFLEPISSYIQRKYEFEADTYASGVAQASSLIQALVTLYRDNANTLTPDPIYSDFYHSHPPASVRIAHLSQYIKKD